MIEIFSRILNMSLTASAVILCVIAVRLLLKKAPKVFSYVLWSVVLFRLLCPVSLPAPVSLLEVTKPQVTASAANTNTVSYLPVELVNTRPQTDDLPEPQAYIPQRDLGELQQPEHKDPIPVAAAASYVWLAGAAVMLLYSMAVYLRLRWKLIGAVLLEGNIYLADYISSPFVMGLFRPRIYLPFALPEQERRYILAHERHHIRRGDHIVKLLAYAALCLHWFNPLVWAAFILAGEDMEMSCDEAVIRKLGGHIRADYSASLLRLSTDRRIFVGTPLAFGEGDTKGRVLNMAKWKKPKLWVSVVCAVVCIAVFAACAVNPEESSAVQTERDTAVADTQPDVPSQQAAPEDAADGILEPFRYSGNFTSADGTIEYTWNLDTQPDPGPFPQVAVQSHRLTEEEARRVAHALFGDAELYQEEETFEEEYTKEELQKKLDIWTAYTDLEKLAWLYPYRDRDYLEREAELARSFVEEYTLKLADSPEEKNDLPCEWRFQDDEISAQVEVDGIPYSFSAYNGGGNAGTIWAYLYTGAGPSRLEDDHYEALLCRTEEPSQEQIDAVKAKAAQVLEALDIGTWYVDECYVRASDMGTESAPVMQYQIIVGAIPQIQGWNPLRWGSVSWNTEGAVFAFAPNGELLSFKMNKVYDTVSLVSDQVQTLPVEVLIDMAQAMLCENSTTDLGVPADLTESLEEEHGEQIVCKVDIQELRCGLIRCFVPGEDGEYQYIPAAIMWGTPRWCGKDSGEVYLTYQDYVGLDSRRLLCLSAIDGSVLTYPG